MSLGELVTLAGIVLIVAGAMWIFGTLIQLAATDAQHDTHDTHDDDDECLSRSVRATDVRRVTTRRRDR